MPHLQINLFGKFSASYGEQALTGLGTGKVQELFCYLLLHRKRPSTREALASLLWGHTTTSQSKAYLRSALWKLRSIFREQLGTDNGAVLVTDPEWIQCNPDFNLWLDVELFEQTYKRIEGVLGHQLGSEDASLLQAAIQLYEGDLLENYYQGWCLYERERFRHLYLVMLDKVTSYCEFHQQYEVATAFAERILALDRSREHTHRQLMHLRYLSEDRTEALHQYESCVKALREDFGIAPAEPTRHLFEQIKTGRFVPSLRASAAPERAPAEPLYDMLDPLKKALDALADAQKQLRLQVEALEEKLRNGAGVENHTLD